MALPQTVSPGQLITADLINEILEVLRGYEKLSTSFNALTQAVDGINTRVNEIEALIETTLAKRFELFEQRMSEIERIIR